jgi:hypothetical protein
MIRFGWHLEVYCVVTVKRAAFRIGHLSMNESADYGSRIQYCLDKAAETSLESKYWLMVAKSWANLRRQLAARHQALVQPPEEPTQLAGFESKGEVQPKGVDFCQFSVVNRQLQSASRSHQVLRRGLGLIRKF